MATTWTFQDAWLAAQNSYNVSSAEQIQVFATNTAVNELWMGYDWRGTVLPLDPFWVVPGEQDYGKPLVTVPSNFFGIREAYLTEVGSNNLYRHPLLVQENIEKTGFMDFPKRICYKSSIGDYGTSPEVSTTCGIQSGNGGFRVWPCPSYGMASPLYLIEGTYKARPPKIQRADMGNLLFWDDIYFDAVVDCIRWAALKNSGRVDESIKQYAVFKDTIQKAMNGENRELGEPSVHPTEALTISRANLWGGLW